MSSDTVFGWGLTTKDEPIKLIEVPLKTFDDNSVDMKVTHCGLCASDFVGMNNLWGYTAYPCVAGHEIAGICTAVGSNVKHIKVGDRIGVGAQSGSCHRCKSCVKGEENLCSSLLFTLCGRWPNGDIMYGGFADRWRGDHRFVFKIPKNMTNEVAATFFCAGITTYAPLVKYGVTKGSKVGVIGIGGLGHFAIQWAKAMGAEVVAFSSSERKRDGAVALGCSDYVVTSNADHMKKHQNTFTHIVCTAPNSSIDSVSYFNLMATNSHFVTVALASGSMNDFAAHLLIFKQISFVGSLIGPPSLIEDMLQFAVKHDIKPWIKKYPMQDIVQAMEDYKSGNPKYRFVLEN